MLGATCQRITGAAVVFVVSTLSLLVAGVSQAADQTEYLKKPPTVLAEPGLYIDATTGRLSYERARALVRLVLPLEDTDSPDFYCAIHVLSWGDDTSTIDKSHWYVYRGRGTRTSYAGRWTPALFSGSRIYGSDRLAILYVHLNVPATTRMAAETELAPLLATGLPKPTGTGNYTIADLLPANADPAPALRSAREQALRSLGSHIVEADYTNISYEMSVIKKLPAPIQNLQDAIGMLQAARADQPFVTLQQRVALYAADVFDVHHVPSDITITGTLTNTTALASTTIELGKQTYDNEGLYYWDVSLGIPVTSVTQLDFETSGGEVFAKEVDKAQLMALMNIFWRPVDTKNTKLLLIPSPIVGLALSKKPLSKIMVGLSIGLNRVQVYGGRQWSLVDQAAVPAADAPATAETKSEYEQSWVAGINVPVRQVIAFLKAKK